MVQTYKFNLYIGTTNFLYQINSYKMKCVRKSHAPHALFNVKP